MLQTLDVEMPRMSTIDQEIPIQKRNHNASVTQDNTKRERFNKSVEPEEYPLVIPAM